MIVSTRQRVSRVASIIVLSYEPVWHEEDKDHYRKVSPPVNPLTFINFVLSATMTMTVIIIMTMMTFMII